MSTLGIRNTDPARALVVRLWHRSNAFMSDGGSPWLDEDGAPTGERSRDHTLPPGATLALDMTEELALTVLPAGDPIGIADSVRGYLRSGSTDSGVGASAVPFSLTNEAAAPLLVRLFASATFQFSPLRELALAPGETATLSTGEAGISVRVDRMLTSRS